MNDQEIYMPTAAGQHELHSSATNLSASEIELLVRMDGALTLAQIRAGMPTTSDEAFAGALDRLLARRLVSLVELDAFALNMQASLERMAVSVGKSEADAGLSSLKRTGYFVRIARKRASVRAPAQGQVLTAVVVEDDPQLAKFVRSYLSFEGFKVRTAGNRAEVLAEFKKRPVPDLVLLDVMLPDVDGFDILINLRRTAAFTQVPIIMLTGKTTREAVLKGLNCGADGYITKPFEPEALMAAVQTVMGSSEPDSLLAASQLSDPWVNGDAKLARSWHS